MKPQRAWREVGAQKAESRHRRHERNTREARKDRRIIECLEKQWRGGGHQQLGRSSIASIAHPFGTYFLSCLTPAAVIRRGSQAPSKDVLHCESANKSFSRAPSQSLDAQELTPDQPLGACSSVSHRGTFCRIRSALGTPQSTSSTVRLMTAEKDPLSKSPCSKKVALRRL